MIPAPKRGEIVREIGRRTARATSSSWARWSSLEMGKILAEGEGEVQEMIDIADFAVGLSRQLYGLTMHSERPGHRMYEQWHPLGIVGVISAFNFPVAVWAWNAMIAAVCGDCVLWRPSSETPLCAIAVQKICNRVFDRHGLKGVFNLVIGPGKPIGEAADRRPRAFRWSASPARPKWAGTWRRRWRAGWAAPSWNWAATTASSSWTTPIRTWCCARCCSARWAPRGSAAPPRAGCSCSAASRRGLTEALVRAYRQVRIGDPLDEDTLMGPLVNRRAVDDMMDGAGAGPRAGRRDPVRRRAKWADASWSPRWCARGRTCPS